MWMEVGSREWSEGVGWVWEMTVEEWDSHLCLINTMHTFSTV